LKQNYLEAGKIRNTHALKGEVKLECWLGGGKPLAGLRALYLKKDGTGKLVLRAARVQGDVFLVSFEGIDTVEAATPLKGKTVYAAREELDPKGEKIFFADLIGLPLTEAETGEEYGKILEVTSRGASELYLIRRPDGKEAYFPAVKEFLVSMDADKGVQVRAPRGIFD